MSPASNRNGNLGYRDPIVACTLPGRRTSDAIELVYMDETHTGVVLLDLRAARDQDALRARLAAQAHASLVSHEPMHVMVAGLRKIVCDAVAASVGLIAMRISIDDARVELLNAGMPPVACVLPDGRMLEFLPLSSDVGPRMNRAHPYELIPLSLGSTWLLASDGATEGSLEDSSSLWSALGLPDSAHELGRLTGDGLGARLGQVLGPTPLSEDASLVVVETRPYARSESGIT
jgi:hypothetical protein